MPVFTIRRRIDAFIDYEAEIAAPNANEATALARANASLLRWRPAGHHEFQAQTFIALDAGGGEIESSECGDFD